MEKRKGIAWVVIGVLVLGMGCVSIVDDDQQEFDLGTYGSFTQWNAGPLGRVELNAAGRASGTGTYLSDVKDATTTVGWETITWTESMPYGTELPGGQMSDISVNMSNNVLLLHLNESSGTLNDSSGQGNNGTSSGSPFYGAFGRYATALGFDGVDDYIEIPDSASLNPTSQMTVELWYKASDTGNREFIEKRTASNAGGYTIQGDINGSSMVEGWFYVNGTWCGTRGQQTITPSYNQWHHVTSVFSGTQVSVYIDGQLDASVSCSGGIGTTTAPLRIGASNTGLSPIVGTIDEVAIYGRILASDEILTRYKRGVLEVALQGRSCATPCTVEPWSISFYDPGSMLSPNLLLLPLARYFQYSIIFITGNSSYTPEVQSVTIVYSTPEITNVSVRPSPTNCARIATLSATTDAEYTGAIIQSAEYYIDSTGPYPMSASDGAFDFITENVTAAIDVTALSNGDHTITIRAQDSRGLWSTFSPTTLTVSCSRQPHDIPSLLPLAQTNITQAKELLKEANTLFEQAKANDRDVSSCEKLIDEAEALLKKSQASLVNPIYANNLALQAIAKLKQALECLKALVG